MSLLVLFLSVGVLALAEQPQVQTMASNFKDFSEALTRILGAVLAALLALFFQQKSLRNQKLIDSAIDPTLRLIENVRQELERYILEEKIDRKIKADLVQSYSAFVRIRRRLQEHKLSKPDFDFDPFTSVLLGSIRWAEKVSEEYKGKDRAALGNAKWQDFCTDVEAQLRLLHACERFLSALEKTPPFWRLPGKKRELQERFAVIEQAFASKLRKDYAMDGPIVFTRKSSGLVKGLNWWDIFVIVISAPAGSGILYYSVSTKSTFPGGSVGLSFLIGMVLIFPVIYIAAICSAMIPRSGSLYILISRVISPATGFIAASLFFVGYTLSIGVVAFVATQLMGGILVQAARAAGAGGLQRFGEALQVPAWSAVGGVVLVLLTWGLVLRGVKAFRLTMRLLFYATVGAALVTVVYFFLVPYLGGAEFLFNRAWGAGAYQKIMTMATAKGWTAPPFSWAATLDLLLVVLFSYGGIELISYAGGEVSQPKGKPIAGYLAGWLCLAAIYTVIAFSVTHAFGSFLDAYDFLFQKSPKDLGTIMPAISPSVPFYISSVVSSPWVACLISLCLCLWLINTMVPYFFSPSRLIFALAMDRAIPSSMADVNQKNGAPTKASHLTLAFALAGVLLNFLGVGTVLGTILFCALFVYWLYGLSAALLPFTRPDLYKESPMQKNFAGLPVLTWAGLFCFGVGWFVIFVAIRQLTADVSVFLAILMILALLVYVRQLLVSQRKGIDVGKIYNQLPPD
jgi:GABA permease